MADFGVGIVGAGTIGAVHARAIGGLEEARIVAIAEPRENVGRALAAQCGADWCASLDELLARSDVDVVTLGTPSGMHPDQAVAVARAGKHVVTEKPMAITLDGADRMIAACRDAGVHLAVIFQNRFNPDVLRLKRAMEAGLFGAPVLGNAFVHWYRSADYYAETGGWRGTWALDGGGALMNQSIHTIDLLQWLMGPLDSLAAYTATLEHEIEAEDVASAAVRFASGALGTIQGTTAAERNWPVRVEIRGTAGSATLEGVQLTAWHPSREADLLTPEDLALTAGVGADEPFGAAHQRQFRAIFAALRDGRQPPVPGEEARKAIEIILAIYRAARTGERVTFPLKEEASGRG
ncbi:MAG TPA: Gfo/Idh/MocA family oxidoreductase [Thermomicrobiales bacterium]|nr:Gfo/Idh/MocA family oxidoreductase [Thermomicrobiales bacterium]